MELNVILLVLHVCLALAIISLILLQKGSGASMGASLGGGGGGGAGSIFGASGSSNFLSKTTAILATAFFINSLALAYLAANRDGPTSVVDMIETETSVESVETPAESGFGGEIPLPTDAAPLGDVPPATE
jgi:preprotein translocase subunit SecG